jgi:hypothetical protein
MPLIRTRAALARYLAEHPHLRFEYPGGIIPKYPTTTSSPRTFLRQISKGFVFRTEDGRESTLDFKAGDVEFHDDHFAIRFPADWNVGNKVMRYYYEEA